MRTRAVVATTIAGLGLAGAVTASRRAAQRAAEDFYDWRGSTEDWPTVNGIPSRAPAFVNRLELFTSFHAADHEAIAQELPSQDIHPVRLPDGRAIVAVSGLHYREITNTAFSGPVAPPYGEVMVAAMVSRSDAPPILPMAALLVPLPAAWRAGMFPLFVPVTHRWSRDGGWAMGVPKFLADLDFEESATMRQVSAAEAGQLILSLRVPLSGNVRVSHQPLLMYAAADERLYETETPTFAYVQMGLGGKGVELRLGDHPVAQLIRDLGVATMALGSVGWIHGRLILPTRREVGSALPYSGYRGTDGWFGRYTIRYPGTAPIDQYAYLSREGIERALVTGGAQLMPEYATIDEDLGHAPPDERGRVSAAREHEVVAVG
jgi:hypothetical protein